MTLPFVKSVFISYRRQDSSPIARWLGEVLTQNFGRDSTFVDTSAIRTGDEWPKRIEQALKKASVLIAVIGPEWLKVQDKHFQRRIDSPHDWVRNEILYALKNRLRIIPLLVLNANLPESQGLPPALKGLLGYQALELREEQWQTDIEQLLKRLEELGFDRVSSRIRYPEPRKNAVPLTEGELKKILRSLSKWRLVDNREGPDLKKKVELMRCYEFASFEDAIHFMSTATRHISKVDHHPDWENVWKAITVWLTTWDIGHKPSDYDVELAQYLERHYQNYVSGEEAAPPKKRRKVSGNKRRA